MSNPFVRFFVCMSYPCSDALNTWAVHVATKVALGVIYLGGNKWLSGLLWTSGQITM